MVLNSRTEKKRKEKIKKKKRIKELNFYRERGKPKGRQGVFLSQGRDFTCIILCVPKWFKDPYEHFGKVKEDRVPREDPHRP